MIAWRNPSAFAWLILAALPIVIHLLRTFKAHRALFPSLRFIRPLRTAAVRLHLPSDAVLLAVRVGIVIASVLALAGPIVVTQSRRERWNNTTARVVLVDASESVRRPGPAARVDDATRAELATAQHAARIDAADLEAGLERAEAWLDKAPPARREIVVVSDLQLGSVGGAAVARVHRDIGLRFVRVAAPTASESYEGSHLLGSADVVPREQTVELTRPATRLTLEPVAEPGRGLRFIAMPPADERAVLRAVAAAGVAAPSDTEPLAIHFGVSIPDRTAVEAIAAADRKWMLRAVLRMTGDVQLQDAMREVAAPGWKDALEWWVVARNGAGGAVLRAAAAGRELILQSAAAGRSFAAAAVVRSALNARDNPSRQPEQEVAQIDDAAIAAWSRRPGPPSSDAWRRADEWDSRWLWISALVLLLLEARLRRERGALSEDTHVAAA